MALVLWRRELVPATVPGEAIAPRALAREGLDFDGSAAATEETKGPDTGWVVAAYLLIAIAAVLGWGLWKVIEPGPFSPAAGFSVFAPLYLLAQGIERFIEPFAKCLGAASAAGKKKTKPEAEEARNEAFAALAQEPTATHGAKAAAAQALLERIRRNTTVIAWGIASTLGMVACGVFGIRLLGASGFSAPAFWDIAISGLAVGSGTKPLHDLISNLQKSKDAKANPPGAVTTD